MKTLSTSALNVVICWNNLKKISPKDIPTIEEMEKTLPILDALEEAIPELVEIVKEGEKIQKEVFEIKPEEMAKRRQEFQKKSMIAEKKSEEKIVKVDFEDDQFNTFFQQFERWGKNWFDNLRNYLEFRKNLNETNKQPKEKNSTL